MANPSAVSLLLLLLGTISHQSLGKETASKKEKRIPQTLSRGWGDQLHWVQTYEEGLYKSKTQRKPLMVIFHLEDCPHSQALKKAFAAHKEIQELCEEFIMLNLIHETSDKHLSPDGQYVPRFMFIDPTLTVRADVKGKYENRQYTYEPQDLDILYANMKKVLNLLKPEL
ncbi:anterior gradient protein 2 homolog [Protopterus annectens]|uniref:anterior gradient protein 2 homolog n=1 Tax=Protopterus annectens TaxID=7888 RepID=UPI001CFA0A21|nr:anterior gradient protein 2 homolog [Protopterus annectens]XP_043920676.1 anterior gradient protein 2 homolog [Protopterus annectens]